QQGMGNADLNQIRNTSADWQTRNALIRVEAPVSPQGAFTTPEMMTLERDNLRLMLNGKGKALPVSSANEVRAWAERRGLAFDQTSVAELTLSSNDWLTA